MPDRNKDRDDRADARDVRADARDHEADARDVRHSAANAKQRDEAERFMARRRLSGAHDEDQESQAEADENHQPNRRRRRTVLDYIILAGAASGALIPAGALLAALFDYFPPVKAAEVRAIEKRLGAVESNLTSINIGQKQMQELQLQDRVQKAEERLATFPPGSLDAEYWRSIRNETRQRLDQIQTELRAAVAVQGSSR